jgi:hypothetical protein
MTAIIAFTLILEYILFRSLFRVSVLEHRLGGYRVHILYECFFFWPSNSLFQTVRGSRATLSECTFWKVHITQEFFRAPHGFTHESTRTTLVSTQQYLGATRRIPSPTMICLGAWRTRVLGVPYRDGTRMGLKLDHDLLRDARQGGVDFKLTRST